jgi:hypothetical protein
LSCAEALPASKTEIEAAHSSPTICFNLMCFGLRKVPPGARLLTPEYAAPTPAASPFYWPVSIA